jgi:hypothetical protein
MLLGMMPMAMTSQDVMRGSAFADVAIVAVAPGVPVIFLVAR